MSKLETDEQNLGLVASVPTVNEINVAEKTPTSKGVRAEANYLKLKNIKPKGINLGGERREERPVLPPVLPNVSRGEGRVTHAQGHRPEPETDPTEPRHEGLWGDNLKEAAGLLAQQILTKMNERQGGVPTFCDNSLLALIKQLRQLDPVLPWEESLGAVGGREGEQLGMALERLRLYLARKRQGRFVDFAERLSKEGGSGTLGESEIGDYELIMSQGVGDCMHWKGKSLFKSVFDFSIYTMLLWDLKPRTIIEIGSGVGSSAVWMADLLKTFGTEGRVYSVDLVRPDVWHADVTFIEGDCRAIENAFGEEFLRGLPHPWLFIEDAHANVLAVVRHFHPHFARGDYVVIEDSPGKRDDIGAFVEEFPGNYKVDTHYTDFFGRNSTCSRDSILVRM